MTPDEAARLLATAAAFDNRTPSKIAKHAWASALHDLPLDNDTIDAVARYYSAPAAPGETGRRWIEPHHVRTHRTAIRNERLGTTIPAYKPPTEPETGRDFTTRRRAQLTAIADGREQPVPVTALNGGPHPRVARALEGVGDMPADDQPYMPADFRESIGMAATPPELRISCPKDGCRALARQPCKTPRGHRRATPHQARTDAARGTDRSAS
ncbi:hypothetical protein GPA10_05030 [Streptomyces sp. p1417]|uniref:Uncharacterized protein n=1 Tax=Streptomyces typhae TaxID=2681492 RepID=A0A6L6WRE6_9ACTN|nr:hypothetical protein [Streptomyces typhae]MVO84149.1 hypothetical protein [Streptomyces typhae]